LIEEENDVGILEEEISCSKQEEELNVHRISWLEKENISKLE
jgi:hypothetical protein